MAWDPTVPTNSGLLINAPQQIRDNWTAIALGTDSALQITNAKIASSAAIADSKLATISTAGKVLGSALNTLSGVPSGAGQLPLDNIPTNLTGKNADQLDSQEGSYYLALGNATGTLAVAKGGLGADFSAQAWGSILYFSATGVISALAAGTSGQFLKTQGAGANPTWGSAGTSQMFLSTGTFTAPTGVTKVMVTVCGGGGGGGGTTNNNRSGGGGAGAHVERVGVDVVAGNNYTVTVGAGGAGGVGAADGVDGGVSSFAGASYTISVNGGGKGLYMSSGGAGGAATGSATINGSTGTGGGPNSLSTAGGSGATGGGGAGTGGGGGGNKFGKGGNGGVGLPTGENGSPGVGFGAGGGGAGSNTADFNGGAGTSGFVLVEY